MKNKALKRSMRVVAVILVASLFFQAVQYFTLTVQARDTLQGIKEVRNQIANGSGTYKILEIVPDRSAAEIGYLIGGQEPFSEELWDDANKVWMSWQEKVAECNTDAEREALVNSLLKSGYDHMAGLLNSSNLPVTWLGDFTVCDPFDEGAVSLSLSSRRLYGIFGTGGANDWDVVFTPAGVSAAEANVSVETAYYVKEITSSTYSMVPIIYTGNAAGVNPAAAANPVAGADNADNIDPAAGADNADNIDPAAGADNADIIDPAAGADNADNIDPAAGADNADNIDPAAGADNADIIDPAAAVGNADIIAPAAGADNAGIINPAAGADNADFAGFAAAADAGYAIPDFSGIDDAAEIFEFDGINYFSIGTKANVIIPGDLSTVTSDYPEYYTLSEEYVYRYAGGTYDAAADTFTQGTAADGDTLYRVAGISYNKGNGEYSLTVTKEQKMPGDVCDMSSSLLSYKGGFKSEEWFKRYVLDIDEAVLNNYDVRVSSLTPAEVNNLSQEEINEYDLIYINNGLFANSAYASDGNYSPVFYEYDNDLSEKAIIRLFKSVNEQKTPCIIDASINFQGSGGSISFVSGVSTNNNIFLLATALMQSEYSSMVDTEGNLTAAVLRGSELVNMLIRIADNDKNFVNRSVWSVYGKSLVNASFPSNTAGNKIPIVTGNGFDAVYNELVVENKYRLADSQGGYGQLSTDVYPCTVMRHIINYSGQRIEVLKKNLEVLEIQPAIVQYPNNTAPASGSKDTDEFSPAVVSSWLNGSIAAENINITTMTVSEFIGKTDDLNVKYDMIYFGTDIYGMNKLEYTTDIPIEGEVTYAWSNKIDYGANRDSVGFIRNLETGNGEYITVGFLEDEVARIKAKTVTVPIKGAARKSTDSKYFWYETQWNTNLYVYAVVVTSSTKFPITNPTWQARNFPEASPHTGTADIFFGTVANQVYAKDYFTVYNDPDMYKVYSNSLKKGLIYTHTGDIMTSTSSLAGLLDTDYVTVNGQRRIRDTSTYRFSGNDITAEKYNALMDYIDGSYPVVLSDKFYSETNGVRSVDGDFIDNSSYLYEFADQTLKNNRTNVVAVKDIKDGNSSLFSFYINKPKLTIANGFTANGTRSASDSTKGTMYHIYPQNGKYYLQCGFTIQDTGAVDKTVPYAARLMFDANADGKFSTQYEEIKDVTITMDNGTAVSSNALQSGVHYTLTKQIPDSYKGILTWAVQVSQSQNPYVRSMVAGYTKLEGMELETIKILQITKDNGSLNLEEAIGSANMSSQELADMYNDIKNGSGSSLNVIERIYHAVVYGDGGRSASGNALSYWWNGQNYKIDVPAEGVSNEFDFEIRCITVDEYNAEYEEYRDNEKLDAYLTQYDMLILGFSDGYANIDTEPMTGPGGILEFIESGKSVLFAHDTTSFTNEASASMQKASGGSYMNGDPHFIYTMNIFSREAVGMDAYGITFPKSNNAAVEAQYSRLRTGVGLTPADTVWQLLETKKGTNGRYIYGNKDLAYKVKSSRQSTVAEVQGYTYNILSLRSGALNSYGYRIYDPNGGFDYGKKGTYLASGGNAMTEIITRVNEGQITTYPYLVPDTFKIAGTHAQWYQLDMNADSDKDGQTDLVVWYCLSNDAGRDFYSSSPNDVRNNYYIYSKGNVTYTGMGHSGDYTTVDEAKLFINTLIAAYRSGISPPDINVMDRSSNLYIYYDEENQLTLDEDAQRVYFKITDHNLVRGEKKIVSNFYVQQDGSETSIAYKDDMVPVRELSSVVIYTENGTVVSKDNLQSGVNYYFEIPMSQLPPAKDNNRITLYLEAQTIITTAGNVTKTGLACEKIDLVTVELFKLD